MRLRLGGLLVVGLILLAACGGGDDTAALEERIADLEQQLAEATATTTTSPTTTSTMATTLATTTMVELSAAQRVYCEDLISVIQLRAPTGGLTARPETVAFMQIAHELGYLTPPGGESPERFVMKVYQEAGAWTHFVAANALRREWQAVLGGDAQLFEQAFSETCLQAWELR